MTAETGAPRCGHEHQGVRRKTYANGTIHYVAQRLTCGAQTRALGRDEAVQQGGAEAPEWDERLREAWGERQRDHWGQRADENRRLGREASGAVRRVHGVSAHGPLAGSPSSAARTGRLLLPSRLRRLPGRARRGAPRHLPTRRERAVVCPRVGPLAIPPDHFRDVGPRRPGGGVVSAADALNAAALDARRARVKTVPWEDERLRGATKARAMLRLGVATAAERDRLRALLDRQWAWLVRHPDDERHDAREEAFVATLRAYQAVCDALRGAEGAL